MNLFLIVVFVLIGLFISFQVFMFIKSKKSVGNPIPFDKLDDHFAEKIKNKKSVLYFHSPTCHNCKTQTPIIESLKKEFDSIFSIDISEKLEIARTFNVMGTPSLLFLGNNKIEGFYVGVKDERFIREKLQTL